MNNLKITLDPYEGINTVSLDGRPVSPYSELSNYIKQPFLDYAGLLFDSAEREINDEFSLTVVSENFEVLLLSALQQNSESCKSVTSMPFQANFKVDKRFTVIASLAKKYGLSYACEEYRLPAFCEADINISTEYLKQSAFSEASLCIVKNTLDYSDCKKNAIILICDEQNGAEAINGAYYWHTDNYATIFDAMVDRYVKIPFIVDTANKLLKKNDITAEDRELVTLAVSVEPLLRVSDIGKIEVGKSTKIEITTIPESTDLPPVRAEIDDPTVAVVEGLTIKAIAQGETFVKLYKADDIIAFEKKKLTVFRDNTVKNIVLDRPEPKMGIGKSQQIKIVLEPNDAADAGYIVWSVDDSDIAEVDNCGMVYAKSAGRVTVTASTSKVHESVTIDVLPNITQMTASLTDIKLLKGETAPIEVFYEPKKCFNNNCIWTTNDANVAVVETLADGSSYIRTVDIGMCVVSCIAEEGGCSVSCNVEVLDPEKDEEKQREQTKKKQERIDLACIIGIPLAIIAAAVILWICLGGS